jgi:hypothetical protein
MTEELGHEPHSTGKTREVDFKKAMEAPTSGASIALTTQHKFFTKSNPLGALKRPPERSKKKCNNPGPQWESCNHTG